MEDSYIDMNSSKERSRDNEFSKREETSEDSGNKSNPKKKEFIQ